MSEPMPAWWPTVAQTTGSMRWFAAILLDHAVPSFADDVLRLAFDSDATAAAWTRSECGLALSSALDYHEVGGVSVEVAVA